MSKGIAYGETASSLEGKISSLKEENQSIELKIATLVSCSNIAQKALENGFVLVSQAENTGNHTPVAFKR
jgi:cell division protein FtsL